MIKALAIKELRESLGVAILALLGMTWAMTNLMGIGLFGGLPNVSSMYPGQSGMAFVTDGFHFFAVLFIGGLAVALGLKQSTVENARGTYHYLLHRPVSRLVIFGTKVAVGVVLTLLLLAGSILCYANWAGTAGNQAAPFEWSMTLSAWKLALVLPLVYLGAFLSGLRPARWFGTRLAPLVSAIVWAFLMFFAPFWWLTLPSVIVGYVCALVATTYFAQSRDY